MLYWIFDLDNTLYQLDLNDFNDFKYNFLKKDNYLNILLTLLPSTKLLFSNGTYNHCLKSLKIMGIESNFSNIISRDMINSLKPNIDAFIKFIQLNNLKPNDVCFFFEDNIYNLKMAKNLGWITIYIGQKPQYYNFINYNFKNIYQALEYFISKL